MNRVCLVVGINAVFSGKALPCGMPHRKHVHDVAPYGEKDAKFPVSLTMKQIPDFFAIGVRIRVYRAALWSGAERANFCTETAYPTQGDCGRF
jgi:hypothetical protein